MTNYKTILIGNNPYSYDWLISLNLIKHNKNIILYDFENLKDIDDLILKNNIEFILPLSNKDYNLISKFDIKNNIKILYPNNQTQELLHNKNLFTKFMLNNFVDFIPEIYYLDEIKIKDIQYPAIYKPMFSTNGTNMFILFNYNDFLNLKNKNNIQQYIIDKYEYGAYMLCINGIIILFSIRTALQAKFAASFFGTSIRSNLLFSISRLSFSNAGECIRICLPFSGQKQVSK